MFRYVGFVWNTSDPLGQETYGSLSRTMRGAPHGAQPGAPGVGVFCAGEQGSASVAQVLAERRWCCTGNGIRAGRRRHHPISPR